MSLAWSGRGDQAEDTRTTAAPCVGCTYLLLWGWRCSRDSARSGRMWCPWGWAAGRKAPPSWRSRSLSAGCWTRSACTRSAGWWILGRTVGACPEPPARVPAALKHQWVFFTIRDKHTGKTETRNQDQQLMLWSRKANSRCGPVTCTTNCSRAAGGGKLLPSDQLIHINASPDVWATPTRATSSYAPQKHERLIVLSAVTGHGIKGLAISPENLLTGMANTCAAVWNRLELIQGKRASTSSHVGIDLPRDLKKYWPESDAVFVTQNSDLELCPRRKLHSAELPWTENLTQSDDSDTKHHKTNAEFSSACDRRQNLESPSCFSRTVIQEGTNKAMLPCADPSDWSECWTPDAMNWC